MYVGRLGAGFGRVAAQGQGVRLGPQLVPAFTAPGEWGTNEGWSIMASGLVGDALSGAIAFTQGTVALVAGSVYRLIVTTESAAGSFSVRLTPNYSDTQTLVTVTAPGAQGVDFTSEFTAPYLFVSAGINNYVGTIARVSIQSRL